MKLVYLAGPYRAPSHFQVSNNIETARKWSSYIWGLGAAVLSPHMNSAFMSGSAPEKIFLRGYLEMVKRCDALAYWAVSPGVEAEIETAAKMKLPIFSLEDNASLLAGYILGVRENLTR